MSETLTLPGFEPMESTESTRSAEASPARTSRSLERVQVLTESEADYGESTPVSLAIFDRASSSWRTSGLFAAEDSPLYSETLPRSGMTRSGTLSLLPPLVRLIYGTGSGSSLPTPTAKLGDARRGMPSAETAALRMAQGRRNLDDALALLPTPCAVDGKDGQTGDLYARVLLGGFPPPLPTPFPPRTTEDVPASRGNPLREPRQALLGSDLSCLACPLYCAEIKKRAILKVRSVNLISLDIFFENKRNERK
jgi:hypothetical protein